MESEQTVLLYDFLYKDLSKISSYYAQLFQGNLTQVEKTSSSEENREKCTTGNAKVLKYQRKLEESLSEETRKVIDPHDQTTTDVLSFLMSNGFVNSNARDALNGELVLIEGSILFMDKILLNMSIANIESVLALSGQKNNRNIQNIKKFASTMKSFFSDMPFSAAFLVKSDDYYYSGTIKEVFLDDNVSSYYMKYGKNGIADIFLIGIKNVSNEIFGVEENNLFGFGQQNIDSIKNFIIPGGTISIAPIAIFRKIKQNHID